MLPAGDASEIADRLEAWIRDAEAKRITRHADTLNFRGYLWGPNTRLFQGIGAGTIQVLSGETGSVRFALSVLPALWFWIAVAAIFAAVDALADGRLSVAAVTSLVVAVLMHVAGAWLTSIRIRGALRVELGLNASA